MDLPLQQFTIKTERVEVDPGPAQNLSTVMMHVEGPHIQSSSSLEDQSYVGSAPAAPCAYVKCAVPTCNNYFDQRPEFVGVSYFPFPVDDPELRKHWLHITGISETADDSAVKICSDHFVKSDIYVDNSRQSLRPATLPRLKLGSEKQMRERSYGDCGLYIATDETTITDDSVPMTILEDSELPVISSVTSMNSSGISPEQAISTEIITVPVSIPEALLVTEESDSASSTAMPSDNLCGAELMNKEPVSSITVSKHPEKGLIFIPASVKPPPLRSKGLLVGDGIITESDEPNRSSSYSEGLNAKMTPLVGDTLSSDMPASNKVLYHSFDTKNLEEPEVKKTRKRRSTRAEMLRREEEDEWEPSFWCKRKWKKDGLQDGLTGDKKRVVDMMKNDDPRSNPSSTSSSMLPAHSEPDDDDDEGWCIAEPSVIVEESEQLYDPTVQSDNMSGLQSTLMTSSQPTVKKRRPGPASKTCRPQYIPDTQDHKNEDVETNVSSPQSQKHVDVNDGEPSGNGDSPVLNQEQDDAVRASCLVEWCFFKSLIPDLRKLKSSKRLEFMNYVLDTLNDVVYERKPIPIDTV